MYLSSFLGRRVPWASFSAGLFVSSVLPYVSLVDWVQECSYRLEPELMSTTEGKLIKLIT